jgi:hypothetical protein
MVGAPGALLAPLRGVRRRRFLALMVDDLGSTAPAPPTGSIVDIS